jgi:hypothetical protein
MPVPKLDPADALTLGGSLQRNPYVRKIYTSVQPNGDGSWDLVTIVETTLVLDPSRQGYRAAHCESVIEDAEADMREGRLAGRVTFRGI